MFHLPAFQLCPAQAAIRGHRSLESSPDGVHCKGNWLRSKGKVRESDAFDLILGPFLRFLGKTSLQGVRTEDSEPKICGTQGLRCNSPPGLERIQALRRFQETEPGWKQQIGVNERPWHSTWSQFRSSNTNKTRGCSKIKLLNKAEI